MINKLCTSFNGGPGTDRRFGWCVEQTAVFVVVTLERITAEDGLQCVCIVHTRELAYQVAKEFERFKAYLEGITVHSIYGGVAMPAQEKSLKDDPPHVVVACPGRLKVLCQKKTLDLSGLKIFVIDEVDKVLEKADMRQDVQEIFYTTPKNKQTMVFSATLPQEIKSTVMKFVRNVIALQSLANSLRTHLGRFVCSHWASSLRSNASSLGSEQFPLSQSPSLDILQSLTVTMNIRGSRMTHNADAHCTNPLLCGLCSPSRS